MANRPHVPKFGDWSNQEQPFTVVFDNARNKRQDLYENLDKPETRTQPQAPPPTQPKAPLPTQPKAPPPTQPKLPPPTQPQAPPRPQRQEPPKKVRDDTPRAPPPAEKPRVKAPPADQYGGGLYGGYGGGGGSVGNQRPPQAPRPVQPKYNPPRGGGRGMTTIPPFPGSLGAGENMSYTHIFDKVKEERNNGGGSYGGTNDNTPSRPINRPNHTPKTSSWARCFPCFRN